MFFLLAPTWSLASQIYSPKYSSVIFVILTQCCCILLLTIVILLFFQAMCLLFLIQVTTTIGLPDTLQHREMSSPGPVYTVSWMSDTRGGSATKTKLDYARLSKIYKTLALISRFLKNYQLRRRGHSLTACNAAPPATPHCPLYPK